MLKLKIEIWLVSLGVSSFINKLEIININNNLIMSFDFYFC